MALTIRINGASTPESAYVTWAPTDCSLDSDEAGSITVRLLNLPREGGGRIQLRASTADVFSDEITLSVPPGGTVNFQIAGKFGQPSTRDRDTVLSVVDPQTSSEVASRELMVRIRKNANDLSEDERDRFLSAMVRLNSPDPATNTIGFLDILQMHSEPADPELHGRPAFLPWHRAYLLDLERRLQAIDPSVALPYWRFDRPAPNVFTRDFMGVPVDNGILDFSATNPMVNWRTRLPGQGNARLRRSNGLFYAGQFFPFDPTTQRALAVRNGQLDTLNLGADLTGNHTFTNFRRMEGDPHGAAHVSFTGAINNPATAPGDPLFFMLHCNVDRLWALWQSVAERYDEEDPSAYAHQGAVPVNPPGTLRIGDFAHDAMWPWNQDTQPPRPPTAPGGQFPKGLVPAPKMEPRVGETIDFQGEIRKARNLGYAFDDVEFAH